MAAIGRRTWDLMKAEFILRVGRENDTSYAAAGGRAEHFLTAAYMWIAKAIHHPELEVVNSALACGTANNTVDISTLAPCIVQAIELQETDSSFIKLLRARHMRRISSLYTATAGEPKYFAQHGENLLMDRLPDALYKLKIYYLDIEPLGPDFGAAAESPSTGWVWDDPILELALVLAHSAVGRHDVAAAHNQIYPLFTGEMPQSRTVEDTQRPVDEAPISNRATGGPLG
jgi:hypothetical protein